MEQQVILKYDGAAAAEGEMDAVAAAEALRGFAEFARYAATTLYGKDVEVRSTIQGVQHGSVEFPFLLKLGGQLAGMFASTGLPLSPMPLADLLKVIGQAIGLMKHLGGKQPVSVKKADHGSSYVENNHGVNMVVNNPVIQLVMDPKAARAAQKFVRNPLQNSADIVKLFVPDGEEFANVNREEVKDFVPVTSPDAPVVAENTNEVYLTIATAELRGKTKWKFYDGRAEFPAKIEDLDFLQLVEGGEKRFGSGDTLLVRLRAVQKKVNGKLKAEYAVEEVIDHFPKTQQQARLL